MKKRVRIDLCTACVEALRALRMKLGDDAIRNGALDVLKACTACSRQLPPGIEQTWGTYEHRFPKQGAN